jgi:hypothetical protein
MFPQQVFSIASSLALVSWILLAILPRRPWVAKVVTTKLVPGLFAILYTAIAVSLFWRSPAASRLLQVPGYCSPIPGCCWLDDQTFQTSTACNVLATPVLGPKWTPPLATPSFSERTKWPTIRPPFSRK